MSSARRILVTGATGYVGGRLLPVLLARGEQVRCFARRPEAIEPRVEALIDRDSKRFAELGLRSALYGEERWLTILADEPLLLKQPLVRMQNKLTIGLAEAEWKSWLT